MPGNLSSLGFGSAIPTKQIVNQFSSGGVSVAGASTSASYPRTVNSGALTAATLATVLTISTAGEISYLTAYSADSTARTIRVVVICDGTTVFDATSDSFAATGRGMVIAGSTNGTGLIDGNTIRFNSSCVVRVASSLTETDKITLAYKVS